MLLNILYLGMLSSNNSVPFDMFFNLLASSCKQGYGLCKWIQFTGYFFQIMKRQQLLKC